MSGFSVNWLDLREPADQAARHKGLATTLVNFLQADADISPIIVDLGSGTGSTLRALTGLGAQQCVWRLVDHDPALLNEALRRHSQGEIVEDYQADLQEVDALPLGGAALLSASALFDLVSEELVDALIARLRTQPTAIYAALNYDGRTEWTPVHPLDEAVLMAFNQDQRRDKGMGPALGPDAAGYMQSMLENAGYRVLTGDSAWLLGPDQQALVADLIRGIRTAVADDDALSAAALDEWQAFRLSHAASGHGLIGHIDVLAFPPTD
ncbi:class I SAM-dependent methyltransferase [Pseudohongiella sp.]|uniref:Methyltransferase domain-containing protein n=1 Tax=marine sediment metagenome TaxID=412755 RepID=A0A0F9W5G9_9ZZZZ|nr:class I SAM-dependent methyltransferase [Pseudohongiella sp.]HDZ09212.1 class I SAM-dependent methyltransferase [Pseudohongiella sp.]HEA63360.1 class I SAM-dependent methyltransferase [Pseudohongiella sp.]